MDWWLWVLASPALLAALVVFGYGYALLLKRVFHWLDVWLTRLFG